MSKPVGSGAKPSAGFTIIAAARQFRRDNPLPRGALPQDDLHKGVIEPVKCHARGKPWIRGGYNHEAAALALGGDVLGEVADVTVHSQPRVSPEACPALVLNADFRPLSYYPLPLWSWQDSIKAVFLDRVNIVSKYKQVVRSSSFEMQLPSVVSLKSFVKPTTHP